MEYYNVEEVSSIYSICYAKEIVSHVEISNNGISKKKKRN
jgi:hypothetical protein